MAAQAGDTSFDAQVDEELGLEALQQLSGGKNGEGWKKFKGAVGTVVDTIGNGDGTVDKKDILPIVIKAAAIAAGAGVHGQGEQSSDPGAIH